MVTFLHIYFSKWETAGGSQCSSYPSELPTYRLQSSSQGSGRQEDPPGCQVQTPSVLDMYANHTPEPYPQRNSSSETISHLSGILKNIGPWVESIHGAVS